jgi:hypothetical protein
MRRVRPRVPDRQRELARDAGLLAQCHEVGLVGLPAVQAVQPPAHRPRRGVRLGAFYCA